MASNKQVTTSTTAILSTSHNESLLSMGEEGLQPTPALSNLTSTAFNLPNMSNMMSTISVNSVPSTSSSDDDELNSGSNINLNTTTSMDPFNSSGGAVCVSPEYLNKSYEDEEDDENNVEYNFVDDFTDLSKELDDNWIQEDELWFNNLTPAMKLAAANASSGSGMNPFLLAGPHHQPSSIHPPRILHRIDEESSEESNMDEDDNEQETDDKQE